MNGNIDSPLLSAGVGVVNITSTQGKVSTAASAGIFGQSPTIRAGLDVDVNVEGVGLSSIKVPLNVTAGTFGTGNILVNGVNSQHSIGGQLLGEPSRLLVDQIITANGNVTLHGAAGIAAVDAGALVQGNIVQLSAVQGAVGTAALPLPLDSNVRNSGGLAVRALGDVHIVETAGDLKLVRPSAWADPLASIYSESGQVALTTANGSILDAYFETFVAPTAEETALRDQAMQLTGAAAANVARETIRSEEVSRTQGYHAYWLNQRNAVRTTIAQTLVISAVDAAANTLTLAAGHGLQTGDQVFFQSSAIDLSTEDFSTSNWTLLSPDYDLATMAAIAQVNSGDIVRTLDNHYYEYQGLTPFDLDPAEVFSPDDNWQRLFADFDVAQLVELDAELAFVRPGKTVLATTGELYEYAGVRGTQTNLPDGAALYVVVDPTDPNKIRLASSRLNAALTYGEDVNGNTTLVPAPLTIDLRVLAGTGPVGSLLLYNYSFDSLATAPVDGSVTTDGSNVIIAASASAWTGYTVNQLVTVFDTNTDLELGTFAVAQINGASLVLQGATLEVGDVTVLDAAAARNQGDQPYDVNFVHRVSDAERTLRIQQRQFSASAISSPISRALFEVLYPLTETDVPSSIKATPAGDEKINIMAATITLVTGGASSQVGRTPGKFTLDLSNGFDGMVRPGETATRAGDPQLLSSTTVDDIVGKVYATYRWTGVSPASFDLSDSTPDFSNVNWQPVVWRYETELLGVNTIRQVNNGDVVLAQMDKEVYGLYRYQGTTANVNLGLAQVYSGPNWQRLTPLQGTSVVNVANGQIVENKTVVQRLTLEIVDDLDIDAKSNPLSTDHVVLTVDAGRGGALQTSGGLLINHVRSAAGGDVRLFAGGDLVDAYTTSPAAITTFGNLIVRSGGSLYGLDPTTAAGLIDPLRIQLAPTSELGVEADGSIKLLQVADDATVAVRGGDPAQSSPINDLFVARAIAADSISIEVVQGNMFVGRIVSTFGPLVQLIAQASIFDAYMTSMMRDRMSKLPAPWTFGLATRSSRAPTSWMCLSAEISWSAPWATSLFTVTAH